MHAHPTLSEVLDELFKAAHVENKAPGQVQTWLSFASLSVLCGSWLDSACLQRLYVQYTPTFAART